MDSNLSFMKEGKIHNIELGSTFSRRKETAFHTVRYDFKPASVDLTQQGEVDVGETNELGETNVSITLPHLQGSKGSSAVYKGSKKPAQKECLLIYDPDTGVFTLERIASQMQVKKIRLAGNIPNQPPTLPTTAPMKLPKKPTGKKSNNKPVKTVPVTQESRKPDSVPATPLEEKFDQYDEPVMFPTIKPSETVVEPPSPIEQRTAVSLSSSGEDSSSSDNNNSSSDDDSSSSNESNNRSPALDFPSQLDVDLQLTDTSDDSDSD